MSAKRLLRRLLNRPDPHPTQSPSSRWQEVRPPAMWGQADSVWNSVWQWLREDRAPEGIAPRTLDRARADFCSALHGLCTRDATDLRQRAGHARSLRELWHLRAELYGVIARHLNQAEAERRLAQVNRHFPVGAHGNAARSTSPRHEHDHHA